MREVHGFWIQQQNFKISPEERFIQFPGLHKLLYFKSTCPDCDKEMVSNCENMLYFSVPFWYCLKLRHESFVSWNEAAKSFCATINGTLPILRTKRDEDDFMSLVHFAPQFLMDNFSFTPPVADKQVIFIGLMKIRTRHSSLQKVHVFFTVNVFHMSFIYYIMLCVHNCTK